MGLNNNVLVLNCGSSSLKFAIINPQTATVYLSGLAECFNLPEARIKWDLQGNKQQAELNAGAAHSQALKFIIETILAQQPELINSIVAIGHRVAHGGEKITQSVVLDDTILQYIEESSIFAPLHNPANLIGIREAMLAFPHLKHKNVGVFDTAFHTTMPKEAFLYAIPKELYEKHGIRRYGFHGTSHQYVCQQAAKMLDKPIAETNIITCHLGNGASITAIKNGQTVDTSMGLTPLEGLVMGTRCGDIDPAIIIFLSENLHMPVDKINDLLNKKSGLMGLTGVSSDCRYVTDHYGTEEGATNALDVFVHRLVKYIGAYSTLLDGRLDAIVFTGGIGENSAEVRKMAMDKLSILGVSIDQERNLAARFGQSGAIHKQGTRPVLVIPTNEELMIAQDTARLIINQ